MAESIHIKELNKGIRETVKGLREVTIKLTPLEEALPEVTQGIGKLEHGAEEAGFDPGGEREAIHQAGGRRGGGDLQAGGRHIKGGTGQSGQIRNVEYDRRTDQRRGRGRVLQPVGRHGGEHGVPHRVGRGDPG